MPAFIDITGQKHGRLDNLTIDRINSDKDYCIDNCQFITQAEQAQKAVLVRTKRLKNQSHAAS